MSAFDGQDALIHEAVDRACFSGDLHIAEAPDRGSMGIADATDYCAKVEISVIPAFTNGTHHAGLTPAKPARSMKKRPS